MINTDENKILGYYIFKRGNKQYDVTIYGGNCLAVMTHSYIDEWNNYNTILIDFYKDEKHIQNMLKVYKLTGWMTEIKLNFYYKEARTLAKYWVKEQNIEIYYQE